MRFPRAIMRSPTPALVSAAALAGWLALAFGAPLLGVMAAGEASEYYASLARPSWAPPGWLFGPVWTALYALMAFAAWLVWRRGGWSARRGPLTLYLVQLALNALWTPIFFGLRQPGLALAEILLLLLAIAATLRAFWKASRAAGALLAPYLAWVGFATALSFSLWRMNPAG